MGGITIGVRRLVGIGACFFAGTVPCMAAQGETRVPAAITETAARPERPPEQARLGPQLGARLGFAAGAGSVYSGLAVSDTANGGFPVIVDAGWRFLPQLYVGLYGQVAPILLKTHPVGCPDGVSCSALDWRFGVEADVHFLPRVRLDPYVGVGAGYEILRETQGGNSGPDAVLSDVTERGWEFGALTLGFDWRVSDILGIGPFVTGTIGEYDTQTGMYTVNGGPQPLPGGGHTTHELFLVGARGTFNP